LKIRGKEDREKVKRSCETEGGGKAVSSYDTKG